MTGEAKGHDGAFLECGILAHGFLRLHCAECGHDKLLAFSCKRRGPLVRCPPDVADGSLARGSLHCLVLDGVYRRDCGGAPVFVEAPAWPTEAQLQEVLRRIIAGLMQRLMRLGVLVQDKAQTFIAEPDRDGDEARTLRPLQAAAMTYASPSGRAPVTRC